MLQIWACQWKQENIKNNFGSWMGENAQGGTGEDSQYFLLEEEV